MNGQDVMVFVLVCFAVAGVGHYVGLWLDMWESHRAIRKLNEHE